MFDNLKWTGKYLGDVVGDGVGYSFLTMLVLGAIPILLLAGFIYLSVVGLIKIFKVIVYILALIFNSKKKQGDEHPIITEIAENDRHTNMIYKHDFKIGLISNEQFQLLAVKAVTECFSCCGKGDNYLNYEEERDGRLSIDLISPVCISVRLEERSNRSDGYVNETYFFSIEYTSEQISVGADMSFFSNSTVTKDILQEDVTEHLKNLFDLLMIRLRIIIKEEKACLDYAQIFKYAFNPISCFKNDGYLTNIRLTPTFRIIKCDAVYNNISSTEKLLMTNEKHLINKNIPLIMAGYLDQYGLGEDYKLGNPFIFTKGADDEVVVYQPLCYLVRHLGVNLGEPLSLVSVSKTREKHWLYLSDKGVIYDDMLIKTPIHCSDNTLVPTSLEYDDGSNHLILKGANNDVEINDHIIVSITKNGMDDIIEFELCSESEKDVPPPAFESLIQALGELDYYDGTIFFELITKETVEFNKKREEFALWKKKHPIRAFFRRFLYSYSS